MEFLSATVGKILLAFHAVIAPLAAAAAAAEPVPAQHIGPSDPKELEAFVDGVMAAEMKDKHIAGATIAFIKDNRPFFAKGYGYADVAAGKPVDPNETMFRVGYKNEGGLETVIAKRRNSP